MVYVPVQETVWFVARVVVAAPQLMGVADVVISDDELGGAKCGSASIINDIGVGDDLPGLTIGGGAGGFGERQHFIFRHADCCRDKARNDCAYSGGGVSCHGARIQVRLGDAIRSCAGDAFVEIQKIIIIADRVYSRAGGDDFIVCDDHRSGERRIAGVRHSIAIVDGLTHSVESLIGIYRNNS